MSTSSSLFCEYCGAANEAGAQFCCFCGRPLAEEKLQAASPTSPTSTHVLPLDTILKGRYRIIKPLGQGGMGTVYRAQDTSLDDRPVALKELIVNDPQAQDTKEAIEAFVREATLLAGLQHPNLPSVYEHFQENGHWYMAMSYIQGETLENHLEHSKRKKLQLNEVLDIGKQLCSVLYYLHSQHPPIIFRDVKPANVMRTPEGHIYLIDFGVARRFKSGQKKDTVPFGSLGYAAPEQFGKAQTTPRSDIYGLGATLYELLSGHEPASTPLKFPALRTLEPALPFKLTSLISAMLNHDENKRPVNMLIVQQRLQEIEGSPWQAAAQSGTLSALPHKNSATPGNAARRPSWRTVSVIGSLLAMLCLIIGGVIGGGIGNAIGSSNGAATALANYQANADAAATADVPITATALASQANATAIAAQAIALPDPYPPKGTLALYDPLSYANQWAEYTDSNFGGNCTFKDGSFQARQTVTGNFFHCDEANDIMLQNFAVEVKMTVLQGDCGGFALRENTKHNGQLYRFSMCSNGYYDFMLYRSNSGADASVLSHGNLTTNNAGTVETIGVVANHSTFDLYVNRHKIASVVDGTYENGTIGLLAASQTSETVVSYQDIMIWALP